MGTTNVWSSVSQSRFCGVAGRRRSLDKAERSHFLLLYRNWVSERDIRYHVPFIKPPTPMVSMDIVVSGLRFVPVSSCTTDQDTRRMALQGWSCFSLLTHKRELKGSYYNNCKCEDDTPSLSEVRNSGYSWLYIIPPYGLIDIRWGHTWRKRNTHLLWTGPIVIFFSLSKSTFTSHPQQG